MPEIPMTSFVDFVLANGPTRLTRVRAIKLQLSEEYAPAKDFYKGIREGIIEFHQAGHTKAFLDGVVQEAHDRKTAHYQEIVKGYRKFLRRNQVTPFNSRSAVWNYRNLDVLANPELGLKFYGSPRLVKLYFKTERLSQRRVEVVLHLMRNALGTKRTGVALLDTRQGKLYTPTKQAPDMEAYLIGEAAAFIEMWRRVA